MSIANISNTTIAPQKTEPLTVNGGSDGVLTMADTGGFYSGAEAYLSATTPATRLCQITQIISATQLRIRFLNDSGINQPQYGTGSDASAFLVANSAKLTMPSQIVYAETRSAAVTSENELKVDIGGSPVIGTVADQGDPNTVANAWPTKITDGVDIALVDAAGSLQVNGPSLTTIATQTAPGTGATHTSVPANAASVTIKAANAGRKGMYIRNTDVAPLFLSFVTPATLLGFIVVFQDMTFEVPPNLTTGAVYGIWLSANGGTAEVEEIT